MREVISSRILPGHRMICDLTKKAAKMPLLRCANATSNVSRPKFRVWWESETTILDPGFSTWVALTGGSCKRVNATLISQVLSQMILLRALLLKE